MRIPDVAEEMRLIAARHGIPRLIELADELGRRTSTKAPRSSNKMTPAIEAKIRKLKARHPDMTQLDIANQVGVNQGRVSETLNGKRT